MALVPIRDIGQYGCNTDVDPLDLPPNVFTYAANARFTANKITRGPVFAKLGESTANAAPRWVYSYRLQGQASQFYVMNTDGTVAKVTPSSTSTLTYADASVAAYSPSVQTMSFTATMLSNVFYVNRQDRVPWALTPGSTQFVALPNWDSTWRCRALRNYNNALVALNVTKGAIDYPTMVKVSDFALFGTVPGTWVGATTNSAYENVIADMNEPILDGFALRDKFMIYGANQTWVMTQTGDALVYKVDKLFSNYGVIGQNCLTEINNLHFVFGDNDIWTHDGFTPKSIANGRVRSFIFNNLSRVDSYQFFVWTMPKTNEIAFCYASTDPYCAFPYVAGGGCNRAAVYNWMYDTWYFYDLPYIVGGAQSEMYTSGGAGLTYDVDFASVTYDTVSGVYQAFADSTRLFNLCVGYGGTVLSQYRPLQTTGTWNISAQHLYSFELLENNSGIGTIVDVVNAPVYIENFQMDLDEISKEIRGYKCISSIYPEGRVTNSANPITFWYGCCDYSGQTITFDDPMTFDGQSLYKLDFVSPGRYISMKMALGNPVQKFTWSGMDLDYRLFGHR